MTIRLAHPPIIVSALEFRDAVAKIPTMRRAPAGAKGSIPKDTILAPDAAGVMVETPVMSSVVAASAPWRLRISVDARRLVEVCVKFKEIGALKSKDDVFDLSVEAGLLKIKFRTTALTIPIVQ